MVFVLMLYLCLCHVLSVDLLWVGVVSVDWSVVCVVFSCSELKCCVLCNLYTFPISFQRSGNWVQSVIPLTAAMICNATHTGDNEFELDGVLWDR